MKNSIWFLTVAILVIIAIGGYFFPQAREVVVDQLGRVGTQFQYGLTIGKPAQSPTNVAKLLTGTCTVSIPGLPLAATSTDIGTCTVTGAETGDLVVQVSLTASNASSSVGSNTHTGVMLGGGDISAAGTLRIQYVNLSGAATSSFVQATSSVQYLILKTQ